YAPQPATNNSYDYFSTLDYNSNHGAQTPLPEANLQDVNPAHLVRDPPVHTSQLVSPRPMTAASDVFFHSAIATPAPAEQPTQTHSPKSQEPKGRFPCSVCGKVNHFKWKF